MKTKKNRFGALTGEDGEVSGEALAAALAETDADTILAGVSDDTKQALADKLGASDEPDEGKDKDGEEDGDDKDKDKEAAESPTERAAKVNASDAAKENPSLAMSLLATSATSDEIISTLEADAGGDEDGDEDMRKASRHAKTDLGNEDGGRPKGADRGANNGWARAHENVAKRFGFTQPSA